MSDKKKPTCCMGQHRTITNVDLVVGHKQSILQFNCKCGTCCRRLALFTDRPIIVAESDWILKAIARVTFGCEAWCYGSDVEVDFKRGVILDLLGDFVNVELEIIEASGSNFPEKMGFGAVAACCGAGAARGCATRTTAITTVSTSGSVLIPVPPFAYAVSFAGDPSILLVADIAFAQMGSGTASPGLTSAFGNSLPDPWMLVGGVESILVVNGGTPDAVFEAVFLIGV